VCGYFPEVVRLLRSFDELPESEWSGLLERSPTRVLFLTRGWLHAWWRTLGTGTLLLALAERGGEPLALAPFCHREGVISFLGTDSSDYLDFIGDASDPATMAALIRAAREEVDAEELRLAMVPEASPTSARLASAAAMLGLSATVEQRVPAPVVGRDALGEASKRRSLVRHERWFARSGDLVVWHSADGAEIGPELDGFFDQHRRRCALAPYDSLFENPSQRAFYRHVTAENADAGWLRFTRVDWRGEPIAFHFGMSFDGSFLWYKPSFEPALARRSPGEVLLRRLMLAALLEDARQFDFGIGDEPFKYRFAERVPHVRTWILRNAVRRRRSSAGVDDPAHRNTRRNDSP
jgi:CelD/BcsL family acetyltransferase involved in cellulose biosynthesis